MSAVLWLLVQTVPWAVQWIPNVWSIGLADTDIQIAREQIILHDIQK